MVFIAKTHVADNKIILAVIDKGLKGRIIEQDNKILDLKSSFYDGKEKTKKEVKKLIKTASHHNIVGENIVKIFKKENLIGQIMTINKVPYSQGKLN